MIIHERIAMHSEDDKKKLNHRLRRVVGQVEAVNRMIEEDAYCVDILMQLSAATGALGKVGQIVLENHLKTCVAEAMESGPSADRDQKLEELLTLFRKYASVID
ncbi:Copper-sensing transcriptional repressor CsoR [Allorhodopirellula heiligendammensis]|uniref:Copper-sensing transcriptional repressor CsoR n=2 Tax=Allorhodopirellula heiligendammensis TaxID=2714739 RepID=A0A5C6BSW3_9BACT|nr:Copper-sensing transcriptional repressor CsoR [Allorhodopirellula heiligendammensis]